MDYIGAKLRELRKMRRLSLTKLADRTGCSASYLSLVENGKVDPGISKLKKIANGLEITIVDLFQNEPNSKVVLRKNERIQAEFKSSKTKIEILVPQIQDKKLDARLAIIAPGGSSDGDYRHPGEEFGLILKGSLDLTVNGVTYRLNEQDSFYFSSTQSHRFENKGQKEAVVVWVNHPASW
jgi:transcriptional regulator with XRE-family HTH domain